MTYYLGKYPPLGQSSHRAPRIRGGSLISQYKDGSRPEECVAAYRDYHKNYSRRRRGVPTVAVREGSNIAAARGNV